MAFQLAFLIIATFNIPYMKEFTRPDGKSNYMLGKKIPPLGVKKSLFGWTRRGGSIKARWAAPSFMSALSVGRLIDAKKVALRRGIWFRVLNQVERSILDLTVRYVDKIKSAMLAKLVTAILTKLKLAMESTVERTVRTIGCSLALKISIIALRWGNHSAAEWATDSAFARYLAIIQMNKLG